MKQLVIHSPFKINTYNLFVVFLLFLFFPIEGHSQIDTVWIKSFGGNSWDVARHVRKTNDGGFIIAGGTESFGLGIVSFYVVKTDSLGNEEWAKAYGGTGAEQSPSIQQTNDGGYIIAGETTSFDNNKYRIYLIKTNALGDILWTKLLGRSYQQVLSHKISSLLQTNDSGYLVSGFAWNEEQGNNDFILFKVDSLGNEIWEKKYGGSSDDFGTTILSTADEGFILAGHSYSYGSSTCDGRLLKLDSEGNLIWDKNYGGDSWDSFHNIALTSDGGYIATGNTQSFGNAEQGYVVKTDALGNEEWSKNIGYENNEDFKGVCQTSDNGYLLSGKTNSIGAGGHDLYLVKIDENGETMYERMIGGPSDDFGSHIEKIGENSYILCGSTSSGIGGGLDFWLIQLEEQSTTAIRDNEDLEKRFALYNNYPNPFSYQTTIGFTIPISDNVEITIYNQMGKKISTLVNQKFNSGIHEVVFHNENYENGVYFYNIKTSSFSETKKMTLIK